LVAKTYNFGVRVRLFKLLIGFARHFGMAYTTQMVFPAAS
jgi:hypothetical protein